MIVWDPIKGLKLHQLEHHQRYVTCVAFSSDGTLLASGSNDKQVALWKLSEGDEDEGILESESLGTRRPLICIYHWKSGVMASDAHCGVSVELPVSLCNVQLHTELRNLAF